MYILSLTQRSSTDINWLPCKSQRFPMSCRLDFMEMSWTYDCQWVFLHGFPWFFLTNKCSPSARVFLVLVPGQEGPVPGVSSHDMGTGALRAQEWTHGSGSCIVLFSCNQTWRWEIPYKGLFKRGCRINFVVFSEFWDCFFGFAVSIPLPRCHVVFWEFSFLSTGFLWF